MDEGFSFVAQSSAVNRIRPKPGGEDFWKAGYEPLAPMAGRVTGGEVDVAGWRPLQQTWMGDRPAAGFQPGWARVRWNPAGLIYDVVLRGADQRNRARRLNELTWELGDVCELFIQTAPASPYIEIHVTPENQRLQLRLPSDGIARVRSGQATLESFMISDPEWVGSRVSCASGVFQVQIVVPARTLGLDPAELTSGLAIRSAVCRYDYRGSSSGPILSSTALLPAPFFHTPLFWSTLRLERRSDEKRSSRADGRNR